MVLGVMKEVSTANIDERLTCHTRCRLAAEDTADTCQHNHSQRQQQLIIIIIIIKIIIITIIIII